MSEYNALRLITEPTIEPISVTEAKAHLVVEHFSDDTLIGALIVAARRHVEARTGRALVRQKWRLTRDCFANRMDLFRLPAQAVDSVNYVDQDGANQVLDATVYTFDYSGYVRLAYDQSWPSTRDQSGAVWIDFWAGYFSPTSSPMDLDGDVPADIKAAIKLLVGHLYEHREQHTDMQTYATPTMDLLLAPYWVPSG